jgi:hypothetical protein
VTTQSTTEAQDRAIPRIAKWSVIGLGAAALFFLLRLGFVEFFTSWDRWQFSLRPELENWALPAYGVEAPATVWALGIALLVASAVIVVAGVLRRRRA